MRNTTSLFSLPRRARRYTARSRPGNPRYSTGNTLRTVPFQPAHIAAMDVQPRLLGALAYAIPETWALFRGGELELWPGRMHCWAMFAKRVMGHFAPEGSALHKHATPDMVDVALAVAVEEHFNRSAPGVPVDPAIANLHGDTLTAALHALADGDRPEVTPEAAQRLVDGVVPDPIHDTTGPLLEAAPDLPGYEDAVADIPEQPQPEPAEGEAGDAPEPVPGMDGFHADLLNRLDTRYGEVSIPDGEGGQVRVSDLIQSLRDESARVDSDAALHEVAAACALRGAL